MRGDCPASEGFAKSRSASLKACSGIRPRVRCCATIPAGHNALAHCSPPSAERWPREMMTACDVLPSRIEKAARSRSVIDTGARLRRGMTWLGTSASSLSGLGQDRPSSPRSRTQRRGAAMRCDAGAQTTLLPGSRSSRTRRLCKDRMIAAAGAFRNASFHNPRLAALNSSRPASAARVVPPASSSRIGNRTRSVRIGSLRLGLIETSA
jgi:hypothetical protein